MEFPPESVLEQIPGESEVADIIDKLGPTGVRELGFRVLRELHASYPGVFSIDLEKQFGARFFEILWQEMKAPINHKRCARIAIDCSQRPRFYVLLEFIWWIIRAGYAIPTMGRYWGSPSTLILTEAGKKFFDPSMDKDHPILPGFLKRLMTRCTNIPDDVLAHLEDARACLDHGLHRPAIVLLGLAYESGIEHLGNHLVGIKKLDGRRFEGAKAWERIKLIKNVLPHVGLDSKEEKPRVERALDFADKLRERRNDASHTAPEFSFDDAAEIEEFLISACRHLPALWLLNKVA